MLFNTSDSANSILQDLRGQHICLITNLDWVYENSLKNQTRLWDVVDNVFFRVEGKHKSLSFMVPYYVLECKLSNLKIQRAIIAFTAPGKEINILLKSMADFQSMHHGTLMRVNDLKEDWQLRDILFEFEKAHPEYSDCTEFTFLKYIKPPHSSMPARWDCVSLMV